MQRTPEEMAFRREKGLCYNCDEKWSSGHRCKGQIQLFIADSSTPEPELDSTSPPEGEITNSGELDPPIESDYPHVSLHALSGLSSSDTFRLYGVIKQAHLTVLIDSGSTHNFLQPRVAQFLHLPTQPTHPLRVLVGNGSVLDCSQVCPQLSLQGHPFEITFHLLPISGADAVLDIEWLKQFGPITTDYTTFVTKFSHLGRNIELHADVEIGPEPVSAPQIKRLLRTGSTSALFHLAILPSSLTTHSSTSPTHPIPAIATLFPQFQHLFQNPQGVPPSREITHRITLPPTTAPVNVRPYRYPHYRKAEIEKQVSELLSAGLIRTSTSPYSSPVLLVKKKDGTWRLCVDYRALNSVTIRDRFPIPTIDELLDELGHATWFSKLDLRQGFHQIQMNEADIEKTAFRTHHGHYEYLVMPFGLCNAPSTFQAAMNSLLGPFLRHFATVFFDDILVYSDSLASHITHLRTIFQALVQGQFYLKETKCLFAQRKLEYLGHVVSGKGVEPEPSKVQAITQWPPPSSPKDLRAFLGLTGFYRKFVRGYASIAAPLTTLLCKDAFEWSLSSQAAFDHLKVAMTSATVLALPNFFEPFIIEIDASATTMGAVLMQQGHPLAFFSKMFGPRLLLASTYIRELHSIITAVRKWRQYLLGRPFTIMTDHKSLRELMTQVIQTPEQHYYLSKLLGYDYNIQYKTGAKVATLFLDLVCKHHGFPKSIVSDHDPIFISSFWRELFRLSGTRLRMSTAYHPQSDGQTEVMNIVLEQYLRSFVHSQPSSWFRYLALAEWSYNTSLHSSSGLTPFEVIYGRPHPVVPHYIPDMTNNEVVDSLITSRQHIHEKLQRRLRKAKEAMKHYADMKRDDVTFNVGQWVYVQLKPFRQQSVTGVTHSKLSKRFFGPFQIIARVGAVAYRLQLPEDSRIHPVFHSSLLRAYHGPPPPSDKPWPLQVIGLKPVPNPLCILDSKMDSVTSPPTPMVLVQWDGQPPEDTTWEPWADIREAYHLEDKVVIGDESIVSSRSLHEGPAAEPGTSISGTSMDRPTRTITRPKHLRDYVS